MSSPRRTLAHRAWRIFKNVAFVAAVVLWAIFLRPQFLGGPAQFILVSGTSMEPQMHSGDLVLVTRSSSYRVGERVAFRIPEGEAASGRVVIHRIVGGSAAAGYTMRGDNRATNDRWKPKPHDVVGTTRLHIPAAGRVARAILTPVGMGLLVGLAVFAFIALGPEQREPRVREPRPQRRRSRVARRPRRASEPTPGAIAVAVAEPAVTTPPVAAAVAVAVGEAQITTQPTPAAVAVAEPRATTPPVAFLKSVPPPLAAKPELTVRACLERTATNLVEAGGAARARRLQQPGEPQPAAAVFAELAAGVQHAAHRLRGRGRPTSAGRNQSSSAAGSPPTPIMPGPA